MAENIIELIEPLDKPTEPGLKGLKPKGEPVIEERERQEKLKKAEPTGEEKRISRRQFVRYLAFISGGIIGVIKLPDFLRWTGLHEIRGLGGIDLGGGERISLPQENARIKLYEVYWTRLLVSGEEERQVAANIAEFTLEGTRQGERIDLDNIGSWGNSLLKEQVIALDNFFEKLMTSDGRQRLRGNIETTDSRFLLPQYKSDCSTRVGLIEGSFTNPNEILENYFSPTLHYKKEELNIIRAILWSWNGKNSEGETVNSRNPLGDGRSLKQIINEYNQKYNPEVPRLP